MKQSSIATTTQLRSFFPNMRAALAAGLTIAALLTASLGARAQATTPAPPDAAAPAAATPTDAPPAAPAQTINLSNQPAAKTRKQTVAPPKAAKPEDPKYKKANPLEGMDAKLPDKELYDKAEDAVKHGRFDVARLDLQTLLNTYPESQFMMRAKLAIADSWYKEGGTAALTQAEQEYRDFITFFPTQPEAAEAQMRIGDIYFREMDKPDRDHSKAVHAEAEYRLMLQQFPESPRVPEAAQRLREVQESLAGADADVAAFYATRQNWAASIARYQTVADTYPLYSHMDDVLIALGDAYEATARAWRTTKAPVPEAARAHLEKIYDDQAAACYRKVVLEHSAAPHVEDARDRLAAMNLPIPTATPEQAAASEALENSRGHYTLSNRAVVLLMHKADTVPAATIGAPPLEDPKPTTAPNIVKQTNADFIAAMNPAASAPRAPAVSPAPAEPGAPENAPAQAPAPAPLEFQDVPTAGNGARSSAVTNVPAASSVPTSGGGVGMEIIQPSGTPTPAVAPASIPFPGTAPAAPAAAVQTPAAAVKTIDGIGPVGPANATAPLPPIEKAPAAPDALNDVIPGSQPAAQTAAPGAKAPKPAFDKSDESSSKHKKKKGLAKLNPF